MGQKVSPHGLRLGITTEWDSVWYSEKNCPAYLLEDYKMRRFIKKKLYASGVSRIQIKRTNDSVRVDIYTAKPGMVIGRSGQAIVELTQEIQKLTKQKVSVNIVEVKRPELNAQLSAEDVAKQLENRVTFRRAMRQVMNRSMKAGAKGIKTCVAGRLGGADTARTEHYHEGTIPLQTLRADIDYGFAEANTTYGKIGVKVWIYKGEVLHEKNTGNAKRPTMKDRTDRRDNRDRKNRYENKFRDRSNNRKKDNSTSKI